MKRKTKNLTATALFAALMCVSAMISIPTPVPITLQTLTLYAALYILGGKRASAAVLLYLSIGAVGLPVFSGASGGVGRLFDATGGFLFGMLACALLWWLLELVLPKNKAAHLAATVITLLTLYLSGVLWYALVYLGGQAPLSDRLLAAFFTCVLPFILPDVIKIAVAYRIAIAHRLSQAPPPRGKSC